MDASDVAAWVAVGEGVIAILGIIYTAGVKLSALEVKVDTMWDFVMRRAMSEAVNRGLATMNSPLVVLDTAKLMMEPLKDKLHDFYQTEGQRMTDSQLQMEIERRFGTEILREVCIPNGLDAGACLLIALAVAKEGVVIP